MKKKRLLSIIPWIVALLLLAWVLYTVPLADTWKALQQLRWRQIFILVMLNGLILALLNARWWIILRGQGERIRAAGTLTLRQACATPEDAITGRPADL